jgi:hypothetical protein
MNKINYMIFVILLLCSFVTFSETIIYLNGTTVNNSIVHSINLNLEFNNTEVKLVKFYLCENETVCSLYSFTGTDNPTWYNNITIRKISFFLNETKYIHSFEYNNTCTNENNCSESNYLILSTSISLNCPSQCSLLGNNLYTLRVNVSDIENNVYNSTPLYATLNTSPIIRYTMPSINHENITSIEDNLTTERLKILCLLIGLWLGCAFIGFSFKQTVFLILSYLIAIFTGLLMYVWVYWWIGLVMVLLNICLMFVSLKK